MWDSLELLVWHGLSQEGLIRVISDLLVADEIDICDARCLVALAWHADQGNIIHPDDVEFEYGDTVKIAGASYRILDEEEQEAAWEAALESYGESYVDGYGSPYFNKTEWKRAARVNSQVLTFSLSPCDGIEHEYCVEREYCDNTKWYLYKVGQYELYILQ